MSNIHPSAVVEEGAQIGENVTVEPFAVVKKNVRLDDGVVIKSHSYIDGHTHIGENTVVYPSASVGTKTQDRKWDGEKTFVNIGKNCEIREFTTINSSCGEGTEVTIGDDCLIMAYCHVAHNCSIGNGVTLANCVNLAGWVTIGDYVNIGGMTPIHQRVRIGSYAMVGGLSRTTHDVPPYTIGGGIPYHMAGLNMVGLKRNNFSLEVRQKLTAAFKLCYRSGLKLNESLDRIEQEVDQIPEVKYWVEFCRGTSRGLMDLNGVARGRTPLTEVEARLEKIQR